LVNVNFSPSREGLGIVEVWGRALRVHVALIILFAVFFRADVAFGVDPAPVGGDSVSTKHVPVSDSSTVHSGSRKCCDPTKAFVLSLILPGGGDFYAGNRARGFEAIVTDVILVTALTTSGASPVGIAWFIVGVHVVEGLFARQSCRDTCSSD
jgi:hypothetical protein